MIFCALLLKSGRSTNKTKTLCLLFASDSYSYMKSLQRQGLSSDGGAKARLCVARMRARGAGTRGGRFSF